MSKSYTSKLSCIKLAMWNSAVRKGRLFHLPNRPYPYIVKSDQLFTVTPKGLIFSESKDYNLLSRGSILPYSNRFSPVSIIPDKTSLHLLKCILSESVLPLSVYPDRDRDLDTLNSLATPQRPYPCLYFSNALYPPGSLPYNSYPLTYLEERPYVSY